MMSSQCRIDVPILSPKDLKKMERLKNKAINLITKLDSVGDDIVSILQNYYNCEIFKDFHNGSINIVGEFSRIEGFDEEFFENDVNYIISQNKQLYK